MKLVILFFLFILSCSALGQEGIYYLHPKIQKFKIDYNINGLSSDNLKVGVIKIEKFNFPIVYEAKNATQAKRDFDYILKLAHDATALNKVLEFHVEKHKKFKFYSEFRNRVVEIQGYCITAKLINRDESIYDQKKSSIKKLSHLDTERIPGKMVDGQTNVKSEFQDSRMIFLE